MPRQTVDSLRQRKLAEVAKVRYNSANQDPLSLAELSYTARKKLMKTQFAIPEDKKYPIHDVSHARNALARVAQHGTTTEKRRVRAAVKKKFPKIIQKGGK